MINKRVNFLKLFLSLTIYLLFSFKFLTTVHSQVVINEASVTTSDNDWIELYSSTDTDISNWYFEDTSGSFCDFQDNLSIGPSTSKYYLVDKNICGKIYNRLNNGGDSISLKRSDGELVDNIPYGGENQVCLPTAEGSIGRYPDGTTYIDRFAIASKNSENKFEDLSPCPSPTPIPTNTPTSTPKPTNTPNPTSTPSPKPTSTPIPTAKPTARPTSGPQVAAMEVSGDSGNTGDLRAQILGSNIEEGSGSSTDTKRKFPIFPIIFMFLGIGFLGFAGFAFLKQRKKEYNLDSDEFPAQP